MSGPDAFRDFVTVIDQHGRLPHDGEGEHHWLCPTHMTAEAQALATKIGDGFSAFVGNGMAGDELGTIGQIAAAIHEDIQSRDLSVDEQDARWVQYMAMSLGYWLDCMVADEVAEEAGATEEQVADVALFREMLRRESAAEAAHGIVGRRIG